MKKIFPVSLDAVANGELVGTSNRRLQNFLFILGIKTFGFEKGWDGYTVWYYIVTDELRLAVKDYATMISRRERMVSGVGA